MATRTRSKAIKPKAIDIYEKMCIVREAGDLEGIADGADVEAALAPKVAQVRPGARRCRGAQRPAALTGTAPPAQKRKKIDLPTPDVKLVPDYGKEQEAPFEPPLGYVRSSARPFGHAQPEVCYTADHADRKWLEERASSAEGGDTLTVPLLERMLCELEEAAAGRQGHLPESEARVHLSSAMREAAKDFNLSHFMSDVYRYWDRKRRKLGKPLLRKYWPQTSANDVDPHAVFRPREKERYKLRRNRRNDMETFRKLDAVRADLLAARDLLSLVDRRERVKAAMLGASIAAFHAGVAVETGAAPPPLPPAVQGARAQSLQPTAVQGFLTSLSPLQSPHEIALGNAGEAASVAAAGRSRAKRRRSDTGATSSTRARRETSAPGTGAGERGAREVHPFAVGGWRLPGNAPKAVINPLLPPVATSSPVTSMCGFSADPADLGTALGVSLGQELSEGTWQALLAGVALPQALPVSTALRVREAVAAATADSDASRYNLAAWLAHDADVQLEAQTQAVRLMTVRNTLGRAAGGGAWEDGAGLALGLGSIGAIGEGWTAAGQGVQMGPPPMPTVGEDLLPGPEGRGPLFLLRPRMGRGSRLVVDRVPLTAASAASWRAAHALLSTRRRARALARRVRRKVGGGPMRSEPALSSALPTHMLSGHAGDATDLHTHYALAMGLPTTHGAEADSVAGEVAPRSASEQFTTHTSWLAPSRYRPASLPSAIADVMKQTSLPRADGALEGAAPGMVGGAQGGPVLPSALDSRQVQILQTSVSGVGQEVQAPPGIAAVLEEVGGEGGSDPPHTPLAEAGGEWGGDSVDAPLGYALDGVHDGFGAGVDVGYNGGGSGITFGGHVDHAGLLPPPPVASGVTLKRLGDVYAMEDSDDDDLVQVAFGDDALFSRSQHDV